MAYLDLCVNVGEEKPENLIALAKQLGFSGICLTGGQKIVSDEIKICKGAEIKAPSVSSLSRSVDAVRNNHDVVIVRGGDYLVNRAACENSRIDILIHPEKDRNDIGLDEYCFQQAAKNKVAIGISFHQILESTKKTRAHRLSHIATILRLAKKFKTLVVICSDANSKWEMRAPRELAAIAVSLGYTIDEADKLVSTNAETLLQKRKK